MDRRDGDRRRRRFGLGGFDVDARALFDRMTTPPTAARKAIINTLIIQLKDDNNWDKLDVLVLLAAADSQASLLDWKNLSNGALVNAPAFVADRGFTGDGATSYINTQFNPSTDGVQYIQNSASYGIYTRTNLNTNIQTGIGLRSAAGLENLINPRNAVGDFAARINTDTALDVAVADSLGLNAMNRAVNNLEEAFKNGLSIATQLDTSQALVNENFYVLARNRIGTGAEGFSTRQQALYFFGSGGINNATFYAAIQAYMTSVGANV